MASLVEWPVVLTAKFEEKFLAVPAEALVYTVKGATRNICPVYANDGKLLPNFLFRCQHRIERSAADYLR